LVPATYDADIDILRAVDAGATGQVPASRRPVHRRAGHRLGETVLAPGVAARLVRQVRRV